MSTLPLAKHVGRFAGGQHVIRSALANDSLQSHPFEACEKHSARDLLRGIAVVFSKEVNQLRVKLAILWQRVEDNMPSPSDHEASSISKDKM
jgi:hypothetical protein